MKDLSVVLRLRWWSALAAAVIWLGAPAVAAGSGDPPGSAVNHSGETYTLDGQASTAAAAGANGHSCAATPDADGVVACFSSDAGMLRASAAAARRGELPPGWLALPPGMSYSQLATRFDGELTAAGAARAHSRSRHRRRLTARAANGYSCNPNYNNTHIWTDANFGGTQGDQGYTGAGVWANYSSTYDNKVSSLHDTSQHWYSRWHDYAYGNGAYYGPKDPCYYVESLTNANMTDGGTANDRFSSFGDW